MFLNTIKLIFKIIIFKSSCKAIFGRIRPAATLVEVSGLIDASLLIEIEAEARRG